MARGLGPVTSLSTSLASAHRHASADGRATGGAQAGAQAGAGGGAARAALRVAGGVGQHALALRRCAPSSAPSGDGGATWRAEGEARHAQPVTAVLCTPAGSAGLQTDAAGLQTDGWLSAALDGQFLSGVAAEQGEARQGEARQSPPQARAVALPPVVEVATTYNKQAADSPPLAGGALFGIALSPCAALLVVLQRLPTLGSVRVKVRVRVRVRV